MIIFVVILNCRAVSEVQSLDVAFSHSVWLHQRFVGGRSAPKPRVNYGGVFSPIHPKSERIPHKNPITRDCQHHKP